MIFILFYFKFAYFDFHYPSDQVLSHAHVTRVILAMGSHAPTMTSVLHHHAMPMPRAPILTAVSHAHAMTVSRATVLHALMSTSVHLTHARPTAAVPIRQELRRNYLPLFILFTYHWILIIHVFVYCFQRNSDTQKTSVP